MPKSKQPRRIKRKSRRPRAADWSGPATKHGPFGLFSNVKLFYFVGVIIMVGSLAAGGVGVCARTSKKAAAPTPEAVGTETPTPSPGDVTPTPTVEQVKQWPAPPAMSIDPAKSYAANIVTDKGTIEVQLFAADAPNTVNNFVFLAQQGFFNNLPFYYVDPESFAATGDPAGNGKGGPGYEIASEPNARPFNAGTLAMFSGSTADMMAGSRFFIVLNPSRLDASNFWPFGEVKSGMDVLQSLAKGDKVLSISIQEQ